MVVDILAVVRRVRHQVVAAAVRIRSRLRETVTAMDTVSAAVRHQIVRRTVHQKVKDISPRVATVAHLAEATITTVVTNPAAEAAVIVPATPAVINPVAEIIPVAEAAVIVPATPAVTNPVVEAITAAEAAVIVPAILADILVVEIIPVAEVAIVLVAPVMDLVAVLVDILVAAIVLAVPVMVLVTVLDIPATLLHARCVPTTRTTIITRARLGRITTIRLTSSYTTSSEWL